MAKWYEIQARGDRAAPIEILIYGDIGTTWDAESITAKAFVQDLQAIQARAITVRINSFGGSVPDGVAIFNALRRHGAHITTEVDGVAVSIASLIAMAGDTRRMAANALLMVHAPWATAMGNATDFREMAALLDKHAEVMADAYAMGGLPRAEALALLRDGQDHWYTPAEALAAGLISEITPALPMAAALPPGRFTMPQPFAKETTMTTPAPAPGPAASPDMTAVAARNREIRSVCAGFIHRPDIREIQDDAIDAGSGVEEVRAKVLAKLGQDCQSLGGGLLSEGYVDTHDNRPRDFLAAARDALLVRNGLRLPNANPMASDLARMGVVDMAERLLSMKGRSTRGMSRSEILAAAHGTSDFTQLLANTAGKALRIGYENEPATHAMWTAEREVADFKTQSLVALSAAPDLLEVKEGAEYTYGTFGEGAESFSVKTYGRLFSITRQALINDDLGAFTRMPAAFGSSARRVEADLVYGKLTGNATMSDSVALFHANHGNLAGTPAALALASLAAARAAMRKQKGIGSVGYIDPQPAFLIVPTALETTAEQLIASLVDPSKSNDTGNVAWIRGLTPIADPRLDADSETAWYLAASPNQIDTIVRAYIAGEQRPYWEEKPDFEKDGVAVKSRIDVGVGVIDYRGLYKNAGA
jgi:ATP-dependent protease ClpP protease subunit